MDVVVNPLLEGVEADTPLEINVTLSERNLEQLLDAVRDPRGQVVDFFLVRRCENGAVLRVWAQSNDEHYERREAGPGFEGIL